MGQKKIYTSKTLAVPVDQMKIPPQAVELEEAVLGAIMIEKDAIIEVIDILKPESFYKDEHQKIYQAIVNLFSNSKPVDVLTVPEQLKKIGYLDEVGGIAYITQLTSRVASASHIEYHARIIHQKFIQRELIRYSSELQSQSFDDNADIDLLTAFALDNLYVLLTENCSKEAVKTESVMMQEINIIMKLAQQEIQYTGIPTNYRKIDRITGGWQPQDLIILAARPSMGKTSISLWFARNAAMLNLPVLIFSLEMSISQLVRKLITYDTGLNSMNLNLGKVTDDDCNKMQDALGRYADKPLYIDETPALTITEIKARAKKNIMKYGIKLIIIDYLQLIQGEKKGTREGEVSSVSRGLKQIAKENNIPIIALSQLNRSIEAKSRKPQLSDLRESGAIEQDADIVIFIDRPKKRGFEEIQEMNRTISTQGLTILDIAKYRNGAICELFMYNDHDSFSDFREDKEAELKGMEIINPDKFIESERLPF